MRDNVKCCTQDITDTRQRVSCLSNKSPLQRRVRIVGMSPSKCNFFARRTFRTSTTYGVISRAVEINREMDTYRSRERVYMRCIARARACALLKRAILKDTRDTLVPGPFTLRDYFLSISFAMPLSDTIAIVRNEAARTYERYQLNEGDKQILRTAFYMTQIEFLSLWRTYFQIQKR